jgi:nucleoside-diphosphate-sugar epimerase
MIAILGASGYIGRSLARTFAVHDRELLVLFARDPSVLRLEEWPAHVSIKPLAEFTAAPFSLVINAIGAGDPSRVRAMGAEIVDVTKTWDHRVLETMSDVTHYVFLSSGAVYGNAFDGTPGHRAMPALANGRENDLPPYVTGKLAAEAQHRANGSRSILDLRVFGYADSSISLTGNFFLADLARSVATGCDIVTSSEDMIRDYAGASELCQLIQCWLNAGAPNQPLDLYTLAPVSKFTLLNETAGRFKFAVKYSNQIAASPTGNKAVYSSTWHAADAIGYKPSRNSMQVVMEMLEYIHRRRETGKS